MGARDWMSSTPHTPNGRILVQMTHTQAMPIEEERLMVHYYIGRAIAAWSHVEDCLRYLVHSCFENRGDQDVTHRALSVGFFSIDTTRGRIDFAEGVVQRRFQGRHDDEWRALVQRVRSVSQNRNKLAHWPIREFPKNAAGRRVLLHPWVYEVPRQRPNWKNPVPPAKAQALRDVVKMELAFIAVRCALENFRARLDGRPEPHAKVPERPEDPQSIAKLRAQIRGALALQP
jgi:hypothetical protein